jgi:hypothetical protein
MPARPRDFGRIAARSQLPRPYSFTATAVCNCGIPKIVQHGTIHHPQFVVRFQGHFSASGRHYSAGDSMVRWLTVVSLNHKVQAELTKADNGRVEAAAAFGKSFGPSIDPVSGSQEHKK